MCTVGSFSRSSSDSSSSPPNGFDEISLDIDREADPLVELASEGVPEARLVVEGAATDVDRKCSGAGGRGEGGAADRRCAKDVAVVTKVGG